jgi:hypothetical protein
MLDRESLAEPHPRLSQKRPQEPVPDRTAPLPGGRIPAGAGVEDQLDLLGCERRRGRRPPARQPHDAALMALAAREVLEHRLVGVPAAEHPLI